jgi:hypothetical protein
MDDAEQKRVRNLVLGPGFYGRLATTLQKRFAVDTVMQRKNGQAVCIEEKIVRGHYDKVTLETMSCTVPGRESEGWMRYGKADWLVWAMCKEDGNLLVHVFDFPALQEAFWSAAHLFEEHITGQRNRTASRKVPIDWIKQQGVGHFDRTVFATPEGAEAVKAFLQSHHRRTPDNRLPGRAGA